MFIDPGISPDAISINERAIIAKYDLDVRGTPTGFIVLDALVRKANRGSGGKHEGSNLEMLLRASVSEHKACVDSLEKTPAAAPKANDAVPNGKAAEAVTPPAPVKAAKKKQQPTVGEAAGADVTALIMSSPALKPVAELSGGKTIAEAVADGKKAKAKKTTKPAAPADEPPLPLVDKEEAAPPSEIKGAVLDNSGKRVKASKKEPKEKGPRRYQRACIAIVENPSIRNRDQLKAAGKMASGTARNCLEAWQEITIFLTEKGWLTLPKELVPTMMPEPRQPKSSKGGK